MRMMRHNVKAAASGAAANKLPFSRPRPRDLVQALRETLGGSTTMRLPDRLGGGVVKLPRALVAAVLLAISLALLLVGPSWLGSSRVPPRKLLHLASAPVPVPAPALASATDDGSHGSPAAAPLDSSGSSVGGMVAKHKAALPCKKCKKCRKCPECERWAHVGSAVGADKYGAQYFALCTAVKDQQQDIREWVAHHRFVGAGKIYLYDTGSSPPLNETIMDHIESQLVEYIWWGSADFGNDTGRKFPQNVIYTDCMERHKSRHQFIGFIDNDEFIVLRGGTPSVPALLRHMMAFEPIGALVMNWRLFGSSGHKQRQEKGVLQSYTKCLPRRNPHSVHVKSIVNTEHYARVDGPHHWLYKEPFHAVNEHFQYVKGPTTRTVSLDKIVLHHYVLKSEEEYRQKMKRGDAMGGHKPFSFFTTIDASAVYACKDGLKYGPYE